MSTRKLTAILFADIAGYTALMENDEQQALSKIEVFKKAIEEQTSVHHGEVVQFYGDGCLIVFQSSVDAVACTKALQEIFLLEASSVPVRIGLHVGDVIFKEDGVYGNAVNIASRVESLAIPGAVLLSSSVRNHIKNKPEFELVSLGKFEFKNVEEGMTVYALANEGFPVPKPEEMEGKLKKKEPEIKPAKKKSLIPAILAIVLLLSGSWYIFDTYAGKNPANEISRKDAIRNQIREKKVAVMPFENLSGNKELDSYGIMASDWITQGLIEAGTRNVINTVDVQRYGTFVSNQEGEHPLVENLQAEVTIQGRYYLREDQIIINTNIIDNLTGETIMPIEMVMGAEIDKMNLLEEVMQKILGYWISQDQYGFARKPPRYDAYQEYIKGDKIWFEDAEKALAYMQKAYQMDTNFTFALVRQTRALSNLAMRFQPKADLAQVDSLIKRIRATKKNLSEYDETYLQLIEHNIHGRLKEEAAVAMKAWKLFPSDDLRLGNMIAGQIKLQKYSFAITILNEYINYDQIEDFAVAQSRFVQLLDCHYQLGEYEQVLSLMDSVKFQIAYTPIPEIHIRSLVRLRKDSLLEKTISRYQNIFFPDDPGGPLAGACWEAWISDQPDLLAKYVNRLRTTAEANPDGPNFDFQMGFAYFLLGRFQEALPYVEKQGDKAWKAVCLIQLGREDEARHILQDFQSDTTPYIRGQNKYQQAKIHAYLGNYELAVNLLKQAFEAGIPFGGRFRYKYDATLKPLHGYPPFEEFVRPKE